MNMNMNLTTDAASGAVATSQSSTMGELIFDKFINHAVNHPYDEESPKLFHVDAADPTITSTEVSNTEINASIVDTFFDPSSSSDSTPMFELDNQDMGGVETWTSLFDNDIPVTLDDVSECGNANAVSLEIACQEEPASIAATSSAMLQSTVKGNSQFLPTPMLEDDLPLPKGVGRKSSVVTSNKVTKPSSVASSVSCDSPVSVSSKLDDLGVVAYSRKQRSAPLTPVIPESDDPMAVKRAKNTEAARRSRARKLQRMNQLEDKVKELLQKNSDLENEVHRLRSMLGQ